MFIPIIKIVLSIRTDQTSRLRGTTSPFPHTVMCSFTLYIFVNQVSVERGSTFTDL
jgi:hypothetical protein